MKSFVDQDAALPAVYACPPVRMFTILMKKGKQRLVEGIIPAEYEDDCRTAAENCRLWRLKLMKGELFSQLLP